MPVRVTLDNIAIPLGFVTAEPTAFPLSVKATVLPASGDPPALNVADNVLAPAYVPLAAAGASVVAVAALATTRVAGAVTAPVPQAPPFSWALTVKGALPAGVAVVVATVKSENWGVADEVTELGTKVAVAPVGRPVAVRLAVQPPPEPVNAICTDVAALAPYCVDCPCTTGLGVCAPSTCTLLT